MSRFSIIVVCLNPGKKLIETMESIYRQTFEDYEVVVKDGFSKDGYIEWLQEWLQTKEKCFSDRVFVHRIQDKSIYEAMNQATELATGEFLYFLNCGDYFYKETALAEFASEMELWPEGQLFYGNIYDVLRQSVVQSNPHVDAFACYRNVPCHQACVYHRSLFTEHKYQPQYRVRADYEHFLWCFFERKVRTIYVPVTLTMYEGGGFSETKENRIRSKKEHKQIIEKYMSKAQIARYRAIMLLSLQPLRTAMAESKAFGALYQKIKKRLYR